MSGALVEGRVEMVTNGTTSSVAAPAGQAELTLPDLGASVSVRARSEDGLLWSEAAQVEGAPTPESPIVLSLQGSRIVGQVVDEESGAPIEGASIYLGEEESWRPTTRVTDANGRIDVVAQGRLDAGTRVRGYQEGYHPGELALSDVGSPWILRLKRRPTFAGLVHLEDGSPAAGAQVRLQLISYPSAMPPERRDDDPWERRLAWISMGTRGVPESARVRTDILIETDASGRFVTPLPFAAATVRGSVELAGHAIQTFDTVPHPDEEPIEVEIGRDRAQGGTLRLVDEVGAPLRGIMVWLQEDSEGLEQRTFASRKTDEHGRIPTEGLPVGQTVRITLTPDPDHPEGLAKAPRPPSSTPFTWTVEHTDQVVVAKAE